MKDHGRPTGHFWCLPCKRWRNHPPAPFSLSVEPMVTAAMMTFKDRTTGRIKTFNPLEGGKPLPDFRYVCAECVGTIAGKRASRLIRRTDRGPETRPFMDRVSMENGQWLRQALLL